jgi:hypothetical protein
MSRRRYVRLSITQSSGGGAWQQRAWPRLDAELLPLFEQLVGRMRAAPRPNAFALLLAPAGIAAPWR